MMQDKVTDDLKKIVQRKKILKVNGPDAFALGSAAFSPRIKRDKALVR